MFKIYTNPWGAATSLNGAPVPSAIFMGRARKVKSRAEKIMLLNNCQFLILNYLKIVITVDTYLANLPII